MRAILRRLPILVAVAMLWACPNRPVEPSDPVEHNLGNQLLPQSTVRDLDILFVIDNSKSMLEEQQQLTGQLDALMQALNELQGGFPNAHIGIVSSDLGAGPYRNVCAPVGGDAGRLQSSARIPGCSPPGEKPFIEITNADNRLSGNIKNVDTPTEDGLGCQGEVAPDDRDIDLCDIQAAFRCIATLGTSGCGLEHTLEAARRALTCNEEACTNPGFLRSGALLAVVFVTDEDDCSASNGNLFDPQQTTKDSELGPPGSYRCFEFGITCDEPIDRSGDQALTGCRSKTVADVGGNVEDLYLHPIQEYKDFFSTLRPENRVVLAAISGPERSEILTGLDGSGNPELAKSCSGEFGVGADPAVRVHELVRSFGTNGIILADQPENAQLGICADDFRPALKRLGEIIKSLIKPECLGNPLIYVDDEGDTKLIESPDQATCSVVEVSNVGTSNPEPQQRERCLFAGGVNPTDCPDEQAGETPGSLAPDSPSPCWYVCNAGLKAEGGDCDYGWQLRFCRSGDCDPEVPAPPGTDAYVQCLGCDPTVLGCLCGDHVCQPDLGENRLNCKQDCGQ